MSIIESSLTKEQVNFFHDNGYLVIRDFVSNTKELEALKKRISLIIDNEFDINKHQSVFIASEDEQHSQDVYFLESSDKIHFFLEKDATNKNNNNDNNNNLIMNKIGHALHDKDEVFKHFSFKKQLLNITRQIFPEYNTPGIVQSMYIFKPPYIGGEVTPHRDNTFVQMVNDVPVLGFWFPIEDATIHNGCLWGVPGSHKHGIANRWNRTSLDNQNNHMTFVNTISDEHELQLYKQRDQQSQYVPLEMKSGDVILLHGHFLHKSLKNESDKPRDAYTFHIADLDQYDQNTNWLLRQDGYPQYWESLQ
jgi:phytanoyl-CoA hydroxylase